MPGVNKVQYIALCPGITRIFLLFYKRHLLSESESAFHHLAHLFFFMHWSERKKSQIFRLIIHVVVNRPITNKQISMLSVNSRRTLEEMVNVLRKFYLKVRCTGLSATVDCLKRGCVILITRLVFLNPA